MTTELRALTTADIPAWNRLLAAIERVEKTGDHYNEADLAEEMANPDIELGKDLLGAFDGDRLVGYFCVYPRGAGSEYHKIALEGAVDPQWRGRGVGTQLAMAMMTRAAVVHAARHPELPALYALSGMSGSLEQADLMVAVGLQPERWNFSMRALLDDVTPPPTVPEGFELKRYDAAMAGDLHAAHNAEFLDHPHFTPWSDRMWKQWVTESRNFRPEHSFVLLDSKALGKIASYVQTDEFDASFEATGRREADIGKVGALRAYRGRGLASTLLQHCLQAYKEAGYDEASLDVDSANPTGVLGIYERAGFVIKSKRADYTLVAR